MDDVATLAPFICRPLESLSAANTYAWKRRLWLWDERLQAWKAAKQPSTHSTCTVQPSPVSTMYYGIGERNFRSLHLRNCTCLAVSGCVVFAFCGSPVFRCMCMSDCSTQSAQQSSPNKTYRICWHDSSRWHYTVSNDTFIVQNGRLHCPFYTLDITYVRRERIKKAERTDRAFNPFNIIYWSSINHSTQWLINCCL